MSVDHFTWEQSAEHVDRSWLPHIGAISSLDIDTGGAPSVRMDRKSIEHGTESCTESRA